MSALDKLLGLAPPPRPLEEGAKYTVFLSYRSLNRRWVINLYDVLRLAGHTVFLDQTALVTGKFLADQIEEALESSQSGVMIWSQHASDSTWVKREYQTLLKREERNEAFQFVPIKLDDAELPPFAETKLFLDFGSYSDGPNGGELLRLLFGLVGQPLSDEAMRFAEELSESSKAANNQIGAAIAAGSASTLLRLFSDGQGAWDVSPVLGARVIEGLAKLKRPNDETIAHARELVSKFPTALRPKQMLAHLLTRSGTADGLEEAQLILGELYQSGERDPETMGLYGRTFFDAYQASGDDPLSRNKLLLTKSAAMYLEGFEASRDDTYTGINAAAKSVFVGTQEDVEVGKKIARKVLDRLGTEFTSDMDYWDRATIAEAMLLTGDTHKAAMLYQKAVEYAPTELESHKSTFRQVRHIADAFDLDAAARETLTEAFSHLRDV